MLAFLTRWEFGIGLWHNGSRDCLQYNDNLFSIQRACEVQNGSVSTLTWDTMLSKITLGLIWTLSGRLDQASSKKKKVQYVTASQTALACSYEKFTDYNPCLPLQIQINGNGWYKGNFCHDFRWTKIPFAEMRCIASGCLISLHRLSVVSCQQLLTVTPVTFIWWSTESLRRGMSLCLCNGRRDVVLTLPCARMHDRDRRASQRPLFIFVTLVPYKELEPFLIWTSLFCILSQAIASETSAQQQVPDGRRLSVAIRSSVRTCEMLPDILDWC